MAIVEMKWNAAVVCLSILIAFLGAYTTINLYDQFRLCSKENQPKLLNPSLIMFLMACSLGGVSIWTMHFVAMASVTMYNPIDGTELEIRYRYDYTLISLVVVIFLCYVGLLIGSHDRAFTKDKSDAVDKFIKDARALSIAEIRKIKNVRTVLLSNLLNGVEKLILAGVIAASGVCVMHYLGMEAMVFDGKITWNGGVIAASVIIAIVAASAAFWILFRLLSFFPRLEMLRVAASVVAALAVNGMHYCGQAAATFNYIEGNSSKTPTSSSAAQWQATIGAIVASAVLLFAILIVAMADLRVWYYNTSAIIRELDMRATLAAGDSHTGAENFLSAYTQLRSTDGSAKAIMEFRVKLKNSSGSGSTSQNQTSVASVLPTDTGDEAALVDADLDKMVSPA